MDAPSNKRARTESTGQSHHPTLPDYDIESAIQALDAAAMRQILRTTATSHPKIAHKIRAKYHEMLESERTTPIDFNGYVQNVIRAFTRFGVQRAMELSKEDTDDVITVYRTSLRDIVAHVNPNSAPLTKQNALEAFLGIGGIIASSDDPPGKAVRWEFEGERNVVSDAVEDVLRVMSEDEKRQLAQEALGEMKAWFSRQCDENCTFEELREFLDRFEADPGIYISATNQTQTAPVNEWAGSSAASLFALSNPQQRGNQGPSMAKTWILKTA